MRFKAPPAAGAVLVAAALAFPVGASAHIETGVTSVRAHTDKGRRRARPRRRSVRAQPRRPGRAVSKRSRREMGQATAEAARLRRTANNGTERGAAARRRCS